MSPRKTRKGNEALKITLGKNRESVQELSQLRIQHLLRKEQGMDKKELESAIMQLIMQSGLTYGDVKSVVDRIMVHLANDGGHFLKRMDVTKVLSMKGFGEN